MIQILLLKPKSSGGVYESGFELGMRAPSVEDIFEDPKKYLTALSDSEQVNVYFTAADCLEEPGRRLEIQHHIPFDIDKIDIPEADIKPHLENIGRVVAHAIGVKYEECNVIFSGNGIWVIVGTTHPITNAEYFDQARAHYKAICDRINLKLMAAGLKGQADPAVWSPARLVRYPETLNRKKDKQPRMARVMNATRIRHDFKLEVASGLPQLKNSDSVSKAVLKTFPTPDTKTILAECEFLKWCQTQPEKVTEPEWYAMMSITGRLVDGKKITHKMSEGHPGYSYQETEMKMQQAIEASGARTCKNINAVANKCQNCKHFGTSLLSPICIVGPDHIKTANTGFYHVFVSEDGTQTRRKPAYEDLQKQFQLERPYKVIKEASALVEWNGTYFKDLHKVDLEAFALEKFKPFAESKVRKEFVSLAVIKNIISLDDFTNSTNGKMNFKNGVLDVKTLELKEHSMEYGFKSVLPCKYDPKAECPRFEQFMRDVMLDRADLIAVVQEFLGYAFANAPYKYHKMLLLVGEGENGKSTLVKVIRALAGDDSVSNLSLKAISKDPQARALLEGKIVNVAEENSRDAFSDTEILKNITGGGKVNIKRLWVQPYDIDVKAKLIALTNEMPKSVDTTHGFFRRMIMIPFDNMFTREAGNLDKDIDEKLYAELPGIFNWIMEGYRRLEKQGHFSVSLTANELLEEYRKETDIIHDWFQENCEITDEDVTVSRDEIYSDFQDWCQDTGNKPLTSKSVFKYIRRKIKKKLNKDPQEPRLRIEGNKRIRMFENIKILNMARH